MARGKIETTATSLARCASCGCDVGKETGTIPFFCDDGDKHEAFCPTCFVYVRSLREGSRFVPGTFVPVHCGACGMSSVSVGQASCMQCRSSRVIVLPPVPGVV